MPDNRESDGWASLVVDKSWSVLTISFYLSQSTFVPPFATPRQLITPSAHSILYGAAHPIPPRLPIATRSTTPKSCLSLPVDRPLSHTLSGPCMDRSLEIATSFVYRVVHTHHKSLFSENPLVSELPSARESHCSNDLTKGLGGSLGNLEKKEKERSSDFHSN